MTTTEADQVLIATAKTIMVMKPQPSPFPLVRIGGNADGAYLIPDDLAGIEACFSPGVSNRKDFEDHITDVYGIDCHMCDKSSDIGQFSTPLRSGHQTFRKKWLDVDGGDDCISLHEWVEELAPNEKHDLVLQMDIEGAEYRNLLATPEFVLRRFRIIVLELHNLGVAKDPVAFEKELGPTLRRLDEFFICVHAHPNNCAGDFLLPGTDINVPKVHELTFLRRDRFTTGSHVKYHTPQLPHPLDIKRNVLVKPPLFLNCAWRDEPRGPASQIKMLEDKVDYYEFLEKSQNDTMQDAFSGLFDLASKIHQELRQSRGASRIPDAPLVEIARGKQFVLSSRFHTYPKAGSVDKKLPFFFHTGFGYNQFITIDLGLEASLHSLVVSNRSDTCKDRARYLFYTLHSEPVPDLTCGYPLDLKDGFISGDGESTTQIMGAKSRYVTIFSPAYTALHFSQVQVFAAPA